MSPLLQYHKSRMEQLFDQADRRLSSGLPILSTFVPGIGLLGILFAHTQQAQTNAAAVLVIVPILFFVSSTSSLAMSYAYAKLLLDASEHVNAFAIEIKEYPRPFYTKRRELTHRLVPGIYKPYFSASALGIWSPWFLIHFSLIGSLSTSPSTLQHGLWEAVILSLLTATIYAQLHLKLKHKFNCIAQLPDYMWYSKGNFGEALGDITIVSLWRWFVKFVEKLSCVSEIKNHTLECAKKHRQDRKGKAASTNPSASAAGRDTK